MGLCVLADDEIWVINNGWYCQNDHPEAGEISIASIRRQIPVSAGKEIWKMKTFGAGGGDNG
jgi:hypothetical protein